MFKFDRVNSFVTQKRRRYVMKIVAICKEGSCCPVVEVDENDVRIGEEGNLCCLNRDQWNTLVEKIRSGELARI